MDKRYENFLKELNVIDEQTFLEVLELFPTFNGDFSKIDNIDEILSAEDLAESIANTLINSVSEDGFCDGGIDIDTREIYLEGFFTLKELKETQKILPGWTIVNIDEIKEYNEEDESEDILERLKNKYTTQELEEIVTKYNLL